MKSQQALPVSDSWVTRSVGTSSLECLFPFGLSRRNGNAWAPSMPRGLAMKITTPVLKVDFEIHKPGSSHPCLMQAACLVFAACSLSATCREHRKDEIYMCCLTIKTYMTYMASNSICVCVFIWVYIHIYVCMNVFF